jgi:hypothetical protein
MLDQQGLNMDDEHPFMENADRGLGSTSAPMGTRDVRLLAMALRENWPMDLEKRQVAIQRLERVVADPLSKPRAFHVALRELMSLSRINLTVVDVANRALQTQDMAEQLEAIKADLAAMRKGDAP